MNYELRVCMLVNKRVTCSRALSKSSLQGEKANVTVQLLHQRFLALFEIVNGERRINTHHTSLAANSRRVLTSELFLKKTRINALSVWAGYETYQRLYLISLLCY